MPTLQFIEDEHAYYLDGVRLPGVTGILQDMGLIPQYPPGPYRFRGKQVHKATCLVDAGTVEQYELGEGIAGYVESYKRLVQDFDFDWEHTEYSNYDKALLVAGTADRVGINRRTGRPVVLDFKTGVTGDVTRLQLAAYARMWFKDEELDAVERRKVYLDKDGGPPTMSLYEGRKYAMDQTGWVGYVYAHQWERSKKVA